MKAYKVTKQVEYIVEAETPEEAKAIVNHMAAMKNYTDKIHMNRKTTTKVEAL